MPSREHERLREPYSTPIAPWRRWGPYVSERAWGTVREDYSADGNAWAYFPHDHARLSSSAGVPGKSEAVWPSSPMPSMTRSRAGQSASSPK